MYSFDISYPINKETEGLNLRNDIKKIIEKYSTCKLYSEDVSPYGKKHSRRYWNFGCFVNSHEEMKNIIKDVKEKTHIFVNFVNSYRHNDDLDPLRIYTSPVEVRFMSPQTRRRYDQSASILTEFEREIFELLNP